MDETQPLLAANLTPASAEDPRLQQRNNEHKDIVAFLPHDDPDDPLQWPLRYKSGIIALLAFMAFTVTFTCIGVVPVADRIVRDLEGREHKSASVLLITIWELGESAGPLFIAPLSEVYGRYTVYNAANACFILGVLLAALSPSSGLLIFARFLTGCAVASNVLNPAIIGDILPPEQRGKGMSAVFLAPLLGGAVGPAIAGAIAESLGWRSILWMALALAVAAEAAFLALFSETYSVRILRRRASRLRLETGNERLRTAFDVEDDSTAKVLWRSIFRPARVLWSSLILQGLSLWGALGFTFFYIMSTTLPEILQDVYGFGPAATGVVFLSFSVGSVIGVAICNLSVDRIYIRLSRRQDGKPYPEGRLPLTIIGAICLPAAVALYGYVGGHHLPTWALVLSICLLGCALLVPIVAMTTYIADAFGVYSASAMTAVLITRCLMGTFLPLAVAPLTHAVGYVTGFLILAAAALALAPIPALVMRYGSQLRQRCEFTRCVD